MMSSTTETATSNADLLPTGFRENTVEVNGVNIHYVIGGTGDALVLLHGWPQTWYSWHNIMPKLAERYTVIAPDLRGAGGSSKPPEEAGYDSETMAEDIYHLLQSLGFESTRIVGHDIGLLVAYAFAAKYPQATERLVILDGLLVGMEPMTSQFNADSRSWVFGLHQTADIPEMLTAGREREYISWFYQNIAHDDEAITQQEIDVYADAYSMPGAMSAGFHWFRAFDKVMEFNKAGMHNRLDMPVLALGGEKMMGQFVVPMMQQVAENVQGGSIPDCGHWIVEEKPDVLLDHLNRFLP